MNNVKKWYQSRLVWSGIIKIVAGIATSISQLLVGDMNFQTFISGLVVAGWGIYDIVLRFNTNKVII